MGKKLLIVLLLLATICLFSATPRPGELVEYQIINFEPQGWIVTAKETLSGNVIKFRLPPNVFRGQTFDAQIKGLKPGSQFAPRGPSNARLDNIIMQVNMQQDKGRMKGKMLPPRPRQITPGAPLTWEIHNINPANMTVMAKNRMTSKTIRFKVNPECFKGFRFLARAGHINRGAGFSIITPNESPFIGCCTLLE